jgi:MFS family permease
MAKVVTAPAFIPPLDGLRALDRLNFFLAALLSGFGPFVPIYLTDRGWSPEQIGFVLTSGGVAALATQIPAGELLDITQSKRTLVGVGSAAVAFGAAVFALWPELPSIFAACVLEGAIGGILGLGVAAISLGLVGHDALGERLGRNQRFASIGGLAAAAAMGIIGYYLSSRYIFFATAALDIPVLLALAGIKARDIHFGRSCGAPGFDAPHPERIRRAVLLRDRRLLVFAVCLFLFQLANASILPLAGEMLAHAEGRASSLVMAALVVFPQIVVAILAPWAGRIANSWGRRPLLLLALGIVPVRALVFATTAEPAFLIIVQALDGITGAALGVLTALIVADLTNGTGRFNLAQGVTGAISGIGASLSTSLTGTAVGKLGDTAGFLAVTAIAVAAVAIAWAFMLETKPASRER